MADGLTPRQNEVLRFIEKYFKSHGYAPSYREICQELNFKSTNAVSFHVNQLVEKGYLKREKGIARSLVPVTQALSIPLYTRSGHLVRYITVDASYTGEGEFFAVEMDEALGPFKPGDLIVVAKELDSGYRMYRSGRRFSFDSGEAVGTVAAIIRDMRL